MGSLLSTTQDKELKIIYVHVGQKTHPLNWPKTWARFLARLGNVMDKCFDVSATELWFHDASDESVLITNEDSFQALVPNYIVKGNIAVYFVELVFEEKE